MVTNYCPRCDQTFDTAGAAREHAWERHSACHYCGGEVSGDDQADLFTHWLAAHPSQLSRVDRERANSAVGSLSVYDRLQHGDVRMAVTGLPRRYLLIAGGAMVGTVIAIAGAAFTSASNDQGVSSSSAGDYAYPVIGSPDAATTITYFGNYKCPYCARFSTGLLTDLKEKYVVPGDLAIRYRHLSYINGRPFLGPDAVTAGHADLAVYNTEPETYWDFHHSIFSNQGPESRRWATADTLVEFANKAGVSDTSSIRSAIAHSRYTQALRESDRAAQNAGVTGTPMLVVDGTVINPSADPSNTRRLIESAINSD
jgi:protein-disulfide isomerase